MLDVWTLSDLWTVCSRRSLPAAAASEWPAACFPARESDPSHPGPSDRAAAPVSAESDLEESVRRGKSSDVNTDKRHQSSVSARTFI